jgi:tRNA A-37 threonylcarbamoyl transferase component Bud32
VNQALDITAATVDPALLDLPWHLPLEDWPSENIAALPKGLSRHTVRFAHLGDYVIAIKETLPELAKREYEMLKNLQKLDVPCVEPFAIIKNRTDAAGQDLPAVLITRHLKFSLPYRAMWSQGLRAETATRLVDALALLLVRLHIAGFFWGDVSLSNTLFRRDAGAFAAYLVDAETGQLYDSGLSNGQRENDLEIARVNIAGELMDLVASGRAVEGVDPNATSERIVNKYRELWKELTEAEVFNQDERWRISQRVERLNELGFDIEELMIKTEEGGKSVKIQPKVVDAGHHTRRLIRLTGLDVEENQARRLLNDLDAYRAKFNPDGDEEVMAHRWLSEVFEPVVKAIPRELAGRLEPAEVFHQVLEHRWYLAQEEQRGIPLQEAVNSYVEKVLVFRRDEEALISPPTEAITLPGAIPSGFIDVDDEEDGDWRDKV